YAGPLLKKLAGAVAKIAPIERFNLLSDAFALVQAGLMPAVDHPDLTPRLTGGTHRNGWTAPTPPRAYGNRGIGDTLRRRPAALLGQRLGEKVSLLGWEVQEDESELDRQLRGDLLRTMGTLGDDAEIQARAREVYARYREDGASVDANVLPAVIAILAAGGGEPEYTEFRERFKRARTPQEE